MKIGISTTSLEPSRNGGVIDGIGHYTQHLSDGLISLGHDVTPHSFPGFRQNPKNLENNAMPASFSIMAGMTIGSFGLLPSHKLDVDVFHSTDFKVVPMNVPVVATVWDAIPLVHPEWLSKRARQFAPYILKRMVPYADRIIAGSCHAKKDIQEHFGIPETKISVVPWGIGSEWLDTFANEEADAVLKKYNLEPGYILTVSTIQPRKNIETLLDAYQILPKSVRDSHKLVIVGRFGWGEAGLRERLNSLNDSNDIVWLQNVASDREIRALYTKAHVFVLLSLYEGFGIPLLEAFSSNVPVVSSNRTSLPEVSNGAALEVDPLDVGTISDAIKTLAQDNSERTSRISHGYKRAQEMTIEKALSATEAVYESMLATGSHSGGSR